MRRFKGDNPEILQRKDWSIEKNGDPGRIAAQVISGVGFLGAGAIIQMKGSVRGLTTAASIWMTACLGLAVGAGMHLISICACVFIIGGMKLIERLEKLFLHGAEQKIVRIKVNTIIENTAPFKECFKEYGVHLSDGNRSLLAPDGILT